jgi:hypothetical protein
MYSGNNVEYDNGRECFSPYHNKSTCERCEEEEHLKSIRDDFRRDFVKIEDTTYNDTEDKIDALFQLEEVYSELHIDIDAILNKGVSYLDF